MLNTILLIVVAFLLGACLTYFRNRQDEEYFTIDMVDKPSIDYPVLDMGGRVAREYFLAIMKEKKANASFLDQEEWYQYFTETLQNDPWITWRNLLDGVEATRD